MGENLDPSNVAPGEETFTPDTEETDVEGHGTGLPGTGEEVGQAGWGAEGATETIDAPVTDTEDSELP